MRAEYCGFKQHPRQKRMFLNHSLRPVFFGSVAFLLISAFCIAAQSTDQNLPTPVTTNEIRGVIRARDVGDPRLTTYFFVLDGARGDVFINVVTANLDGDIDIYTLEGLRPRTKIPLFADNPQNETGRVIYLRRSEKLLLRIQGRTPNDDPATYQLKFAGSFRPIAGAAKPPEDTLAAKVPDEEGAVRVNSVGTILGPVKKPEPKAPVKKATEPEAVPAPQITAEKHDEETDQPVVSEPVAAVDGLGDVEADRNPEEKDVKADVPVKPDAPADGPPIAEDKPPAAVPKPVEADQKTPRVIITDLLGPGKTDVGRPDRKNVPPREITVELKERPAGDAPTVVTIEKVPVDGETPANKMDDAAGKTGEAKAKTDAENAKKPGNPLANVFLRVELKNGEKIERPMTEIASVNVIRGVLTIVTTDGKVLEFGILDVLKMSIQ